MMAKLIILCGDQYKKCSICGHWLAIGKFVISRNAGYSLDRKTQCKRCVAEKRKNNYKSRYRPPPPERNRAYSAVRYAIKTGRLIRKDNCENCGGSDHINFHHDDYSKPLEGKWLCASCHKLLHVDIKKATENKQEEERK